MTTLAFIEPGIMGSPMSVHPANAGYAVVGCDRTPHRTGPLGEAGGHAAGPSAAAVADSDVVAIMVPDSPTCRRFWAVRTASSHPRCRCGSSSAS